MTLCKQQPAVDALRQAISFIIVGQPRLLDHLIIGLLAGSHILVEGLPGLAKTTVAKVQSALLEATRERQITVGGHILGSGRSSLVDDSN